MSEPTMSRQVQIQQWILSQSTSVPLRKALLLALPVALATTSAYSYVMPSSIIFTIQLNDPLISSSSNAPKLNSLLGNTRSDPTLASYLVSQRYLCRNLKLIPYFSTTQSRLTKNIRNRCDNNLPLSPYVRSSFAKGERYEDLQVIRFTLQSYDPKRDSPWVKALATFYSNQSKSFAQLRINAVTQAIRKSEAQSSIDSERLRNSLFSLISRHRGPLDEKYKAYSSQLVELEKLSAGFEPQKVKLVSSLAAQLNYPPSRILPLVETLSGLNRDDSEQLLKSLQDINVRLTKLKAGSSEKNPEYIKTLQLRTSLIAEISRKVPGFNQISKLQPNPATLTKTIDTVIELQTLRYQIAENQRLTSSLLASLKEISRELPQYILLQSKITAQDDAIAAAAKDNETLNIELNKLVGTWGIQEGPYIKGNHKLVVFLICYLIAFPLVSIILSANLRQKLLMALRRFGEMGSSEK